MASPPTAAPLPFAEESGIVLDKWIYDVCGEEELQFPSHRRLQFPAYLERLRRVSKTRQFVANTFDYPSRSGTREVLVLQKTLEALASREQAVAAETAQVQESVRQVRHMLEERTMGASTIAEEEKARAAGEAAAEREKAKQVAAAAAAAPVPPSAAGAPPNMAAAQRQGYVSLNANAAPMVAPPVPTAAARSAAPTQNPTPPPVPAPEASDAEGAAAAASQGFSAAARAARRADYEKKRALAVRYTAEVASKTEAMARERGELAQRRDRLLADKVQLDKEYQALQTTEELVVARHTEAASRHTEETLHLGEEAAMYAAELDAFDAAVAECLELFNEDVPVPAEAAAVLTAPAPALPSNEVSPPTSPAPQMPSLSPPTSPNAAPSCGFSVPSSTSSTSTLDGAAAHAGADAHADAAEAGDEAAGMASAPPADDSAEGGGTPVAAALAAPPVLTVPPVTAVARAVGFNSRSSSTAGSVRTAPRQRQREALEVLRHRLSEIGARALTYRRHLVNEGQMHLGRFRQSQQRLKDWQDIAAQLHRTHHQLRGQVETLHSVLADTAARLERNGAAAAGSTQLTRLNALLKERSYEALQYYMGSGDNAAVDMLLDATADEELRALQRPSPSSALATGQATPVRGGASAASSVTPTRQSSVASAYHGHDDRTPPPPGNGHTSSTTNGAAGVGKGAASATTAAASMHIPSGIDSPHRHRSRYELVRHLQRWEAVLLAERLTILKAAHMTPGPFSGAGANAKRTDNYSPTHAYQELRALLLQPKRGSAPA